MSKIIILDPTIKSAVSFYRSVGPFSYLHKLDPHFSFEILDRFNDWTWIGKDILFLQRPYAPDHLQAMEEARKSNLKIWVDTDDLLHDIPKYNPNYRVFNNPKQKYLDNNKQAIKEADVVTVSTEKLREYYSAYNDNVKVIENAHNDYIFPFTKYIGDVHKTIGWRGSTTHRMDLLSVAEQFVNLSKQNKDWRWVFMGNDLWYITELIAGSVQEVPERSFSVYFEMLRKINFAVMVFPLIDNDFNRAKSSNALLEATYGGSVCIAPDLPEFNKPGCLCYKDPQKFAYYVEKCMQSKSFREENYEKAYKYINENLLLSKINRKRLDVIKELAGE